MEDPIRSLARKVFGSANERLLRQMGSIVEQVNALGPEISELDGDGVRRKVGELRERHERGESLDDLLPEAFALVRESASRTIGQRHFDVQLIGGLVLHQGKIAEMKTGEGKTLVATLPSFLNAITGKGVHVVTVNDYLARFHADWMGQVHRYLGFEVGCIVAGLSDQERRDAYAAPITYGQNNEFGFDYLRDNMKPGLEVYAQRGHSFAIVDEVDSILIDEARTPLIISGPVGDDPEKFRAIDRIIPRLNAEDHFTVEEKARQVMLTDDGIAEVERILKVPNLYAPEEIDTLHVVQNSLRAHVLYHRDVDYAVKDGQVVIVDEFTGRMMEGRRWGDGLHQAVEAKEKVKIQNESQTYASVTFQNYFRMYDKLAGMTGTADTEAEEFHKIYELDVVVIPTNQPMIRDDRADLVFRTHGEKWAAVVDEIESSHEHKQPVLVGTSSIEDSEMLSRKLKNRGVPHNVLNAKQHDREADIIAQAGRLGAVTISTNMAGRGTDIVLGGNPEMVLRARGLDPYESSNEEEFARLRLDCATERDQVLEAGGLHVVGSQRHDARRIDNQLRGRSGRQGDPGSSRFYLSLEDDLMRRFGSDRIAPLMKRLGMEDGEPIEHKMVTRAIERAQAKVEAHNFDIRKHLLEYDDVMNRQRETIYTWRREILSKEDIGDEYSDMSRQLAVELVQEAATSEDGTDLAQRLIENQFGIPHSSFGDEFTLRSGELDSERLTAQIESWVDEKLSEKRAMFAEAAERFPDFRFPSFEEVARGILLQNLDQQWKDHLLTMDHLKEGIGLRGYGQRDPKIEYQREGYAMFMDLDHRVRTHAVEQFFKIQIQEPDEARLRQARAREEAQRQQLEQKLQARHAGVPGLGAAQPDPGEQAKTVVRTSRKVGRNEPCPCGSGKKYKKCCALAA